MSAKIDSAFNKIMEEFANVKRAQVIEIGTPEIGLNGENTEQKALTNGADGQSETKSLHSEPAALQEAAI